MKLFVEGGGDSNQLRTDCRKGFSAFITKAGVTRKPKVIPSGSRGNAIADFTTAMHNGEEAMLLIDSEEPVLAVAQQGAVASWDPWQHLSNRPTEAWPKPRGATKEQLHFMVECTESWFLADHAALQQFFGQGFQVNQLPASSGSIEQISKSQVLSSLKQATRNSKKGEYGKGSHSFKILGVINPALVTANSKWAERFIDELKKAMGC